MALEPVIAAAPATKTEYTCPMHPEIVRGEPGSCPICGMALEPRTVTAQEEKNPELVDMTRRFWICTALTIPLLLIAMSDLMPFISPLMRSGGPEDLAMARMDFGDPRGALGRLAFPGARMAIRHYSQPEHVHADRAWSERCLCLQRCRTLITREFSASFRGMNGECVYFEAAAASLRWCSRATLTSKPDQREHVQVASNDGSPSSHQEGQPPQSTTGVAKIHSSHCQVLGTADRMSGDMKGIRSDMGSVEAESSVLCRSRIAWSCPQVRIFFFLRVTVLGSSAIPQIGQEPGSPRTISGCMGHVYSVFVAGAAAMTGSSAIPHFGQSPGPARRTSGSIGQVYSFAFFGAVRESGCSDVRRHICLRQAYRSTRNLHRFDEAGAMPISFPEAKYLAGSALNFTWHPGQQK